MRVALGAQQRDVLRLVLGQGLRLIMLGLVGGLAVSLLLTRWLRELLFGVSANDPLTLAAVALFLSLIALLASYLPARRAMKVDPMIALRNES